MEITYEEPTTIEEISTEVESYEAEIEVASIGEEPEKIAETSNTSGITEREAVLEEVEGTGTGNAGAARENEETISAEPTEENTITETNSAESVEQTEEPVEQSEEEIAPVLQFHNRRNRRRRRASVGANYTEPRLNTKLRQEGEFVGEMLVRARVQRE